ncbi:MAG: ATP-binding cassette domain-containing protein [Candidatus Hydrogenedentes bacterium]|nr:ATP-binding cassette domain-containing protein [Candidatus Hydrogenedentota bacterium]
MTAPLLELDDVRTHFPVYKGALFERQVGTVRAVDGVSFTLARGEVLGLVGESGCGKSTLARTIVRLVPPTSGAIRFEGRDLAALSQAEMRRIRPRLQMVFQDPYASLNPRMTVFDAIAEPMRAHRLCRAGELAGRVADLMDRVGLARRLVRKYPHEFSGGQRQRIAIARALALNPALILADEPVSALDVSVQAQILNLIARLCAESELSLVLISHDLGVVHHLADRIAVMYLGRIVEIGPAGRVFHRPLHPYTRALISAIPEPDPERERHRARMLLRGDPPSPLHPPAGCPFHPRCPFAVEACAAAAPGLAPYPGFDGQAACIRLDAVERGASRGVSRGTPAS